MISITADKNLTILLPHMNKALARAIEQATPEQLKALGKSSDLKSIMDALFHAAKSPAKSDTVLLDILKHSSLFKEMGSFSKESVRLAQLVKQTPVPQKIETALAQLVKTMEQVEPATLKAQIRNSGIFLESKLATPADATPKLKALLLELLEPLKASVKHEARPLQKQVEHLLKIVEEPARSKSPQQTAKALEQILKPLQNVLQKSDVLLTPKVTQQLEALVQNLQKFETLLTPDTKAKILPQTYQKSDVAINPKSHVNAQKPDTVELHVTPERLNLTPLLPQLQSLYQSVLQSRSSESNTLLQALEKIITVLKAPEAEQTASQQAKTVLHDTQNVARQIVSVIQKADPLLSKEMQQMLPRLEAFSKPEALQPQQIMNERIVHDMKATLLQLGEEIKQTPTLQGSEMARVVDKLSLQIDYYQLYSYLNNSSSLYVPFMWEELEEGSVSIKKGNNKKFYCEVNLNLKEHGALKAMLALYENTQVNLHAFCESNALKEAMKDAVSELRAAFIEAGLTLREVRFFEYQKSEERAYNTMSAPLDMGFEVKA